MPERDTTRSGSLHGRDEGDGVARYVMVGGFLGAGKTTALARLGHFLHGRGLRVGLITNDQSTDLVDTAMLRSEGFDVEEIAGGCFCCRFDSLHEAAGRLDERSRPEVFVAEPVGSCTDLVATVGYPLRRIYGDRFRVAPLSVMVDPLRAARIFGLGEGRSFSSKVEYVYRKQLEEADLIVVNKVDLIDGDLRRRLQAVLGDEHPEARVLSCSAREGTGLEEWFELVLDGEAVRRPTMEVDYTTYAEGEALLGWLNCTVAVDTEEPLDGADLLAEIGRRIDDLLADTGEEIAHLKMTLDPGLPSGEIAVVSLVRSGEEPELRASPIEAVRGGHLIINLRAEGDPERLRRVTEAALAATGRQRDARLELEHLEHFRPAPPVPVHRDEVLITDASEG
ncbi:MAG: GTP-binding protein [Acidobacteriota bacterium]